MVRHPVASLPLAGLPRTRLLTTLFLATLFLATAILIPSLPAQKTEGKKPRRPNILLIGDSISIGYTLPLAQLLAKRAEVRRINGNAGHTGMGLARIDQWLATSEQVALDRPWDIIHFNFGLWDLCYRNPTTKTQGRRDKETGTLTHSRTQYAANLHAIIDKLQATGADLIFATTTPVPPGELGRKQGDAARYNDTALEVMHERGIAIDDLHAIMNDRMVEFARAPSDVHFTTAGYKLLAAQVAKSIDRQWQQRASRKALHLPKPSRWVPTRKIEYATYGDVHLKLHVFEPDHHTPERPRPAIVFFFGGGWTGGSVRQFYPYSDYFASRGMVAIAAEYRVKNKHGTTPFECVTDGLRAIRFVREHADELGIDPERIAAGGGSAGGHVAAATATVTAPDRSRPNALLLLNPVYDNGPDGYGHKRLGDRYREISPLHNIHKGLAPTLVMLGTKDHLIPVATALAFQTAMRAVGSRSELMLFDGKGHGFFNHGRGDGVDYLATLRAMDAFLASLDYLEGAPTIRSPRQD